MNGYGNALTGQDPGITNPEVPVEQRVDLIFAHVRAGGGYIQFDNKDDVVWEIYMATFKAARARGAKFFLRAQLGDLLMYEVHVPKE